MSKIPRLCGLQAPGLKLEPSRVWIQSPLFICVSRNGHLPQTLRGDKPRMVNRVKPIAPPTLIYSSNLKMLSLIFALEWPFCYHDIIHTATLLASRHWGIISQQTVRIKRLIFKRFNGIMSVI